MGKSPGKGGVGKNMGVGKPGLWVSSICLGEHCSSLMGGSRAGNGRFIIKLLWKYGLNLNGNGGGNNGNLSFLSNSSAWLTLSFSGGDECLETGDNVCPFTILSLRFSLSLIFFSNRFSIIPVPFFFGVPNPALAGF